MCIQERRKSRYDQTSRLYKKEWAAEKGISGKKKKKKKGQITDDFVEYNDRRDLRSFPFHILLPSFISDIQYIYIASELRGGGGAT